MLIARGNMASLKYKLEYNKSTEASDDAVYIHLREDPVGFYRPKIGKEDYYELALAKKDAFSNGLFNVAGIEEISITAYRVWYMKAPAFTWSEVNTGALAFLKTFFGKESLEEISGSANINGSGLRLESEKNRRTV